MTDLEKAIAAWIANCRESARDLPTRDGMLLDGMLDDLEHLVAGPVDAAVLVDRQARVTIDIYGDRVAVSIDAIEGRDEGWVVDVATAALAEESRRIEVETIEAQHGRGTKR